MSMTVLVVDDSPTIVKFVSFSLKSMGFDVLTATDGMEALERLSQWEGVVDLVITDLNMPNLDGYGLIAALRENRRYQETPVIILSSEEDEEDKARGRAVGATAYLVKPFRQETLAAEVNRVLGQRALSNT